LKNIPGLFGQLSVSNNITYIYLTIQLIF